MLKRLLMETISSYANVLNKLDGLRFLFELENHIYNRQSILASAYEGGVHPKHRLMKYHHFFIARIKHDETVLDIGCGSGFVAYDIAEKSRARVTGIDINKTYIQNAIEKKSHPNVTYICGDVLHDLPKTHYDVIVLSNVLEHIEDRIGFLKQVGEYCSPNRWLIRVPLFERDWRVPLMKEIGVDYRLDPTHFTEYSLESFQEEMKLSGLTIEHMEFRWGEIWSEVL